MDNESIIETTFPSSYILWYLYRVRISKLVTMCAYMLRLRRLIEGTVAYTGSKMSVYQEQKHIIVPTPIELMVVRLVLISH